MQECQLKANQSSMGPSLLLINSSLAWASCTIWGNWKNGYIQAFFETHTDTRKKAAIISSALYY